MTRKALDGKPHTGNSRVRRDGGHKLPLLGCVLLAALNAGAGVLQLSSDTTWTDLSALDGYDGVEIANGRTLTLNPASGTTMNFDKPISGAGGVIKDGAGNLELRAANTFTGLFIIGGTGDVYAYTDGAFGSSAGRTTLYEHLYTGGGASTESSIAGANLYLCGIVTDEGFDIVTKGEAKYLYAQADTENTINGSVTVSGSQASVYALANATLRLRGGVSGSGTLRPSAASNGKVIIENKPLKSSLWNSMADKGCLVLSAPSNTCGYTYLPIVLDCDWAFDGAAVRWETGSKHMKIDLNGHANRVSNIDATDANMNGWVTSTGGKAFLYYKGTSNVSSYVPFRGSAGLFHEGNVTTTLMKNTTTVSDTKGELCVTNGTVTFETTAAWPNASGVTLSGTGRLTLTAAGQIGDKAILDISENSLLTLPENGLLTVAAFKLNGTWLEPGDYSIAQLEDRVAGSGATVRVRTKPREGWISVFADETWDDAAIAALADCQGVYIHEGATLTLFNTAACTLAKPFAGAGTLVLDGTGQLDLNVANPEFDGALHIKGSPESGNRRVNLNEGGFLGSTAGATTVHLSKDDTLGYGCEIWLPTMTTSENMTFLGKDSSGRIHSEAGVIATFNGDIVTTGSQVSYQLGQNAKFIFNKSFSGGYAAPSPDTGAQIIFNCPCTASFNNSHKSEGTAVFNATGNAPLGYFCCTASFGVDFAWDNVDAKLGMNYYNNVKLDLNGHPQRVTRIDYYNSSRPLANCTYVTDTTGTKSFLYVNSTSTADSRVYFKGTAGLYWENTGTVTFKTTTSTSRGDLVVAKGRVIFDDATWTGGDTATVKSGAVLEIRDATKFSFLHIVVEDGGQLVMPNGGTLHACDVTLGNTTYPAGSTVALADHAAYFDEGTGAGTGSIVCDGDYIIDVPAANASTVQEVTINVPAGKIRIVKTGAGTALVKAGSNLSPAADIVIRAGALGVATAADIPVLLSSSTSSITVEDGGTLDLGAMSNADAGQFLKNAVVSLAGAGATDGNGNRLGAIRRYKRTGTEAPGGGNTMFGALVLTADATVCADGLDCGCTSAGRKAMNGHTLTKIGGNQWYWGGETTPGNFVVKGGNFILFNNPSLDGTAENFIRVESGNLMFNNCTSAMTPVPHTLDWCTGSGNLIVYNQAGNWAGPWNITNNLTFTSSAKAPNNGVLTMEGPVVATNKTVTLASSHPGLVLKGTNHSDFATINICGTCELRDGATMEIHPFASGARGEVSIAQVVTKVAEGLPAKLTVSNATFTSAFAAEKGPDYYGDIVLSWNADNVGVLDIQSGAVITGTLFCAQSGMGVVRQSGGEFIACDTSAFDKNNFIGNSATSYGAYLMSGGRFVSSAPLNAATSSGAVALVRQDGGEFVSGVDGYESFDVRSGYFSLYQTGGTFTNASAISLGHYADVAGTGGRREIGVTGPDARQYHDGDIRVGGNTRETADKTVFFLADGATVDFKCFSYERPTGTQQRRFHLGSAGGVLRPNNSNSVFADLPPDSFTLYAGGLVVDTSLAGGDVMFSAALTKPTGKVVTGVTLPADAAFLAETNFPGPAKLTIDGGSGAAATAVTEYNETTRTLSGATVVSPGFGYQAGDAVTATVEGQFRKTSYTCSVTLGDPDTTGGLVKRGANRLVMTGANDYAGVTRIEGGSLEFAAGAYPSGSDVVITAEAADAARLSNSPALIVAGFPNGRTITLLGADALPLGNLDRPIRLARFTGTLPATIQLDVRDSSGNPYLLPTGNNFYLQGDQLFVGKNNGTMLIFR